MCVDCEESRMLSRKVCVLFSKCQGAVERFEQESDAIRAIKEKDDTGHMYSDLGAGRTVTASDDLRSRAAI